MNQVLRKTEKDWELMRELEWRLAVGIRAMERGRAKVDARDIVAGVIWSIHSDNRPPANPVKAGQHKLRRIMRLRRGLCHICGERPHRPGKTTCEECFQVNRKHNRRRRKQVAQGRGGQ